jgi:antitoxin VapB
MPQITIDELPEAFQKLLLEIEQTHTPLTVIYQGQPLVIISPAKVIKPRPAPGVLKGSGEILGDIISPVEQPWEVLR